MANADFGTNICFTHGDWVADWSKHDLSAAAVTLQVNGAVIAQGTGAAALGSPLNVAVWLANHLNERGIGVRSGELVTTGTCTGIKPVSAGDSVTADFGPLGTVQADFVKAATSSSPKPW